jgi:hypothetical protein
MQINRLDLVGTYSQIQLGDNGLAHYNAATKYFMINEDETNYIQSAGDWSHAGKMDYQTHTVLNKTGTYTLLPGDKIYTNTGAGGDVTLNLPAGDNTGQIFYICNVIDPTPGYDINIRVASGTKYLLRAGSQTTVNSGAGYAITGRRTMMLIGVASNTFNCLYY